jgi:hypothetical protein
MAANLIPASGNGKPKLLDQVREVLRVKHFSLRTEDSLRGLNQPLLWLNARRDATPQPWRAFFSKNRNRKGRRLLSQPVERRKKERR